MKITAGPFEVFASGTVIGFKDQPIEQMLTETTINPLVIKFYFKTDNEKPEQTRVESKPVKPNQLDLYFYNFNNPLGIGNTSPLLLGAMQNRHLYLMYRVYSLGQSPERLLWIIYNCQKTPESQCKLFKTKREKSNSNQGGLPAASALAKTLESRSLLVFHFIDWRRSCLYILAPYDGRSSSLRILEDDPPGIDIPYRIHFWS